MFYFLKKHRYAYLLFLLFVMYFIYHTFQGERGLFVWFNLKKTLIESEQFLQKLQAEREQLELRVSLLRSENLDLDILDERARDVLGFARDDEVILYE